MSAIDASRSSNGHGSNAWFGSWTLFRVDRRSPSYCRVTFDQPPPDAIAATTVAELAELVGLIEQDRDLNVVVFDSGKSDFHLPHDDVRSDPAWVDLLMRLSGAPVVSIASIRGRVRGAGREFLLTCDLRFSAREDALLGQFLDDEVEAIASRLARLDHDAIARAKSHG
jgi:enoyl-CoA hydratase/carnithine racemase